MRIKEGKFSVYEIDPMYLEYLSKYDKNVRKKSNRKYYGILITKEKTDYCIPFTSKVKKKNPKLTINIKNKKIDFLKNMSLELYLVQGISQCFFMKTYFCDKSFLYLNNNLLIIILSTIGTIILGYLLKKIDTKIFNIIYRRKEV